MCTVDSLAALFFDDCYYWFPGTTTWATDKNRSIRAHRLQLEL